MRRIASISTAIVASLNVIVAVAVLSTATRMTYVSHAEALARFRSTSTTVAPTLELGAGSTTEATVDGFSVRAPFGASTSTSTPAPAPTVAPAIDDRPEAGIYSYATTGEETFSPGGGRHAFPPTTYATVAHDPEACGWTVVHPLIEESIDRFGFCTEAEGELRWPVWLLERTFFGRTKQVRINCPPPARLLRAASRPGDRASLECTTRAGNRVDFDGEVVSDADRNVGGAVVPALEIAATVTLSGDSEGTGKVRLILDRRTGLRLYEHRTFELHIGAAFGSGTYRQELELTLLSLRPDR